MANAEGYNSFRIGKIWEHRKDLGTLERSGNIGKIWGASERSGRDALLSTSRSAMAFGVRCQHALRFQKNPLGRVGVAHWAISATRERSRSGAKKVRPCWRGRRSAQGEEVEVFEFDALACWPAGQFKKRDTSSLAKCRQHCCKQQVLVWVTRRRHLHVWARDYAVPLVHAPIEPKRSQHANFDMHCAHTIIQCILTSSSHLSF